MVLEAHGLFTWGDTAQDCYETTLRIINRAIDWLETETAGKPAFGGPRHAALSAEARRATAAALMPAIRGMVSGSARMVGHFDDQDAVLEFVNSGDMPPLAALGTSCPDHFLRTKIRPLVVDFDPARPTSPRPSPASPPRSRPTARTTQPTTTAASIPTARRSAIRTRWSTSSPASA